MDSQDHSHGELAQLAAVVRDLTESVRALAREVDRLEGLVVQQTELRDRPQELSVVTSALTVLHKEAERIVERLEGAGEDR